MWYVRKAKSSKSGSKSSRSQSASLASSVSFPYKNNISSTLSTKSKAWRATRLTSSKTTLALEPYWISTFFNYYYYYYYYYYYMLYNTVSTNYKDDVKKVVMRIIIKTVLRDCRQRASIQENKTNTHRHTLVYYNEFLFNFLFIYFQALQYTMRSIK